MKYKTIVKSILDEKKQKLIFNITEEIPTYSDISKITKKHYKEIIDFKENTIKKALIKLGWTPPKDAYKSCHYDPSEDMTDWENDPENFTAKESSERKR